MGMGAETRKEARGGRGRWREASFHSDRRNLKGGKERRERAKKRQHTCLIMLL